MVSDRGRVGDAFGSTVETDERGIPHATCPVCQTVTPWPPRAADATVPSPSPLAGIRLARLAECIEEDRHVAATPVTAGPGSGRRVTVYQPCTRCGLIFASEGFV